MEVHFTDTHHILYKYVVVCSSCHAVATFLKGEESALAVAYDHTTLNTPVLVRSLKLSSVGPAQYLDGWPPGNSRCCRLFFNLCNWTLIIFVGGNMSGLEIIMEESLCSNCDRVAPSSTLMSIDTHNECVDCIMVRLQFTFLARLGTQTRGWGVEEEFSPEFLAFNLMILWWQLTPARNPLSSVCTHLQLVA